MTSSWRNASSCRTAATKPSSELRVALRIRRRPVWALVRAFRGTASQGDPPPCFAS